MASSPLFWWISAVWISLTIVMAFVAQASSALSWALVTVVSVVPPFLLCTIWGDGPPATIAEVLHATERRR